MLFKPATQCISKALLRVDAQDLRCVRKWCAATKIERHLRRLMRNTTHHVAERTLHERDLLSYRRKE